MLASVLTFSLYYPVVRKIGPAKAAYSSVLVPIIAMGFSTWLEDYRWTPLTIAGAVLALGGMAAALSRSRSTALRGSETPPEALQGSCLRPSSAASSTTRRSGTCGSSSRPAAATSIRTCRDEVADTLRSAFAKGVYFNTRIRDRFPHREVTHEDTKRNS